jgi:hypothetical protein
MIYLIGSALFIAGYLIGKEWTEIKYQRRLIDAQKEAAFWRETINKKPDKPPNINWK